MRYTNIIALNVPDVTQITIGPAIDSSQFAKEAIAGDLNRYMANIYSNWLTQGLRQKSFELAKSQFIVTVE